MQKQLLYSRIFGFYQLIGGLIGLGFVIWIPISLPIIFFLQYVALTIGFILYAYCIYCGFAILKNKKNAWKNSFLNQGLQIIHFSFLGFGFQYVAGFYLSMGIDLTNNDWIFKYGLSSWEIEINSNSLIKEIHINIFAVFLIICTERLYKMAAKNNS